jgi:hypothetical protein
MELRRRLAITPSRWLDKVVVFIAFSLLVGFASDPGCAISLDPE